MILGVEKCGYAPNSRETVSSPCLVWQSRRHCHHPGTDSYYEVLSQCVGELLIGRTSCTTRKSQLEAFSFD
jgi:hypothetical protein